VSNSLVYFSLLEKNDAEIIVDIGIVGFDLERFFVMSDCLIRLAFAEKSISKIVVNFSVSGFDLERFIVLCDGFV